MNTLVVNELRDLFKSGATPSALIRRIAAAHVGESQLDALVRAYFREAFRAALAEQFQARTEEANVPLRRA